MNVDTMRAHAAVISLTIFIAASSAMAQQVTVPQTPPDIRYTCQIQGAQGFYPLAMWTSQGLCTHVTESFDPGPCKITADQIEWLNKGEVLYTIQRGSGELVVVINDQKYPGFCQPGQVPAEAPQRKPDISYVCELGYTTTTTPIYVWVPEGICSGSQKKEAGRCAIADDLITWPQNVFTFHVYRKSGQLYFTKFREKGFGGNCKLQ